MDKAFLDWWELNKFKLIENDEVGLREIAYAGWQAGREIKLCEHGREFAKCTADTLCDHYFRQ